MSWNGETVTAGRPVRKFFNDKEKMNRTRKDGEGMEGGPKMRDIPDIGRMEYYTTVRS